jgi:hypothetical protein
MEATNPSDVKGQDQIVKEGDTIKKELLSPETQVAAASCVASGTTCTAESSSSSLSRENQPTEEKEATVTTAVPTAIASSPFSSEATTSTPPNPQRKFIKASFLTKAQEKLLNKIPVPTDKPSDETRILYLEPGALELETGGWKNRVSIIPLPLKDWLQPLLEVYFEVYADIHIGNTVTIGDNAQRTYQLIYIIERKTQEDAEKEQVDSNRNHLAEYLLLEKEMIWGPAALIAIDEYEYDQVASVVNPSEIEVLVNQRPKASILQVQTGYNGKITSHDLTHNEITMFGIKAYELGLCPEDGIEILAGKDRGGYQLYVWPEGVQNFPTKEAYFNSIKNQPPNQTISRFLGMKVYGVWYVSHLRTQSTWGSELLLTDAEQKRVSKRKYTSRFIRLRKRCCSIKMLCRGCNKVPDNFKWCTGCYCMRYCNEKCQAKHWNEGHWEICSKTSQFGKPAVVTDPTASSSSAAIPSFVENDKSFEAKEQASTIPGAIEDMQAPHNLD